MSVLGVAVQVYCTVRIAFHVPPGAFRPRPRVDSSIVLLDRRHPQLIAPEEREPFFTIVRAGFLQKRKQLANTLATGLVLPKSDVAAWLAQAGIDPARRAESLDLQDWLTLLRSRPT
jgi:16S rRNA (adenine1518-N6/adenine1519-N6)-dimethyltransferase